MFRSAAICIFFVSLLVAEMEYNKDLQLFCLPKDTGLNINGTRLLMTWREMTVLPGRIFSGCTVELHIFVIMVQLRVLH